MTNNRHANENASEAQVSKNSELESDSVLDSQQVDLMDELDEFDSSLTDVKQPAQLQEARDRDFEDDSRAWSRLSPDSEAQPRSRGSGRKSRKSRSRRRSANWERGRFDFFLYPLRVANNFLDHWGFDQILARLGYGARHLIGAMTRFEQREVVRRSSEGELVVSKMPTVGTMVNPIWWCVWLFQFPWLWLISRPFLAVFLAVPAVLFLSYGLLIVNSGRKISVSSRTANYQSLMSEATEEKDFDAARFYADALLRYDPHSAQNFLNRAVVEERAGNAVAGKKFVAYAADQLDSEQAALWLADSLGDRSQVDQWPAELQDEYERWLTKAREQNPESATTIKALADLYRARGDLRKAYQTLSAIEETDPSIGVLMLVLEKELGYEDEARKRAMKTIDRNLSRLKESPDLVNLRIQTAKMQVFLGSLTEAGRLLMEGLKHDHSEQEEALLKRALADALVLKANEIAQADQSPRGLMKRLECLQKAVEFDATSRPVLEAVMDACLEAAESSNNEVQVMREAIVQGISSEAAHFIYGTMALMEGDSDKALYHLDIAAKSNPNLPGLLNNLAYAILQQEGGDLERALRLSDAAVRGTGGNVYALETRGQILVRLERWSEAIADLEKALREDALRNAVRPSLATAYEKIGNHELAARHRDLHEHGL